MKYIKLFEQFLIKESISVWHGSTSKFDTFDLSKIGSGDGKNLGGWGFYFSNDKNVSDRYYIKGGSVKKYKIKEGDYFDLDETLDDGLKDQIINELESREVDEGEIEQFQSDYDSQNTNKQVLEWLEYVMGSPKNASMFIRDLGYIGNKFKDRWETESMNYVVFDPDTIIGKDNDEDMDMEEQFERYELLSDLTFPEIIERYNNRGGKIQRIIFTSKKPDMRNVGKSWTHEENYLTNYIHQLIDYNFSIGKLKGHEDIYQIIGETPPNNILVRESLSNYKKDPIYQELTIKDTNKIKVIRFERVNIEI